MRLKLDLVVVIIEDCAYGMIRWKQAVDSFPDLGMTFGNPDFVAYAKSYGGQGHASSRPKGWCRRWRRRLRRAGCTSSPFPIDYSRTAACWWTNWAAGSPMSTSTERQGRSLRRSLRYSR